MNNSGNHQKYLSKNILKRFLLNKFLHKIKTIVLEINPETILDAGCGEGHVIYFLQKHLNKKIKFTGFDNSENAIKIAKELTGKNKNFFQGNLYDISLEDKSFDLVLAMEVLEHLEEYKKAIIELERVSSKYCLISVPLEPFFSIGNLLTGNNIKRWGKDLDHVNFWNKQEIEKIIKEYFIIRKTEISFPWTIILAEKR